MLDTQYRMHPQISAFPNEAFYAGALHDGSVDKHGQPHADLLPPDAFWLKEDANGNKLNFTFVDTDAPESPRNLSIANETEADLVCDVVSDLLAENPVSPLLAPSMLYLQRAGNVKLMNRTSEGQTLASSRHTLPKSTCLSSTSAPPTRSVPSSSRTTSAKNGRKTWQISRSRRLTGLRGAKRTLLSFRR